MGTVCAIDQDKLKDRRHMLTDQTHLIRIFNKKMSVTPRNNQKICFKDQVINTEEITDHYVIEEGLIGEGSFGKVRKAKSRRKLNTKFAIKTIPKTRDKSIQRLLKMEINTLKAMDHPNIAKLFEIYEDELNFHFVLELVDGEELINKIEIGKRMTEREIKGYFYQILKALNHIHSKGICHRDVKPQNFIVSNKPGVADLKIVDFGLSTRYIHKGGRIKLFKVCGSPNYIAPEILKGDYDERSDIWSAGIILYYMVTRNLPFKKNHIFDAGFYKQVLRKEINFSKFGFMKNAKRLCKSLLERCPDKRISLIQALNHPWFTDISIPKPLSSERNDFLNKLYKYKTENIFKRQIYFLIAKLKNQIDYSEYVKLFNHIDRDRDGCINFIELRDFLCSGEDKLANDDLLKLLKSIKWRRINSISYSEFISICLMDSYIGNEFFFKELFVYLSKGKGSFLKIDELNKFLHWPEENDLKNEFICFIETINKQRTTSEIDYNTFIKLLRNYKTTRTISGVSTKASFP